VLKDLARKGLALVALLALAACNAASAERDRGLDPHALVRQAQGLDQAGLARIEAAMDPAILRLAQRFDAEPHADFWGRPQAWAILDLAQPPSPPFALDGQADARRINALLPASETDLGSADPFYLPARGPERARAVQCLTEAVYYEAALEPLAGQQAVAQTVLNRLRHPAFPKSVCGVVYQGAAQPGCQYSFACDGSRARPPIQPYWDRARAVAEAALTGFVDKAVGAATHYHADYVYPRWGPEMVKIVQEGSQIFYRYPGPFGAPRILTGRYAGRELEVSTAGPSPQAIAPPSMTLPVPSLTPVSAAAGAPPVAGQQVFGRRIPTKEEIARINNRLAALSTAGSPD